MNAADNKTLSSALPLEENVAGRQQQPLIKAQSIIQPPRPPTYEQAIADNKPNATSTISASSSPTVVIINEPVYSYGPNPVDVQCPYCLNYCRTRLRYTANSQTHLIALLLCLLQLYCCICLPYCIKSCMTPSHYCGMCDKYLGPSKR